MTEDKATLVINAIINKENIAELQSYMSGITPIFAQNGGVPIARYKAINQLAGDQGPGIIAIFEFPNADTIKTMIAGEGFKSLAEIRARVFSKLNMTICSEM